jgi:hypothetical protein
MHCAWGRRLFAHGTEVEGMCELILQSNAEATTEPCGLCTRLTDFPAGNRLALAEAGTPVCQECGQAHAPSLAALVNLADAAERIGRIGRHSVFPPLTALLDLASAAEKYTTAAQPVEDDKVPR